MILLYQTRTLKATPMTSTTVSAAGGAMPSKALSLNNLIDQETGETNRDVFKGLCRRRAMADYGDLSPRAIRSALRYYSNLVDQMACAWRQRHGLPVATTMMPPYGKQRDGVRRSAF
jgi:hypothetical protein